MKRNALVLGTVCLTVLASLGCGLTARQKLVLADFSRSAATVGEATSTEIKTFREKGIQANTQVLVLRGESTVAGLPTLSSLDRGYELSRVQPVIRAAEALAAYGQTMSALVNDTQTADIKQASTNLMQSIGQIPEAKAHLGQEQLNAFGTVIQEVGGLWVEDKRKKAVLMLVDRFGPAVDRVCDRLIQDFSAGPTPAKGWVYLQLQVTSERLEVAVQDQFAASTTFRERQQGLETYLLASDLRAQRDDLCSQVSSAAAAMKKANAVLMRTIHEDLPSTEDLQDFRDRARTLKSALDILLRK